MPSRFIFWRKAALWTLIFISLFSTSISYAQKSDSLVFAYPCEQNLEWLIETLVENDADAPFVLARQGDKAHQEHIIAAKVLAEEAKNIDECGLALRHYLGFFRNTQLGIFAHARTNRFAKIKQDELPKVEVDLDDFARYVSSLKQPTMEGYWKIDDHLIGIKEVNGEFIGFNIDNHNSIWKPKQIKLRFKLDENGLGRGTLKDVFFEESDINYIHLADANHLSVNDRLLYERQRTPFESSQDVERYKQLKASSYASFIKWNDSTLVLKIPRYIAYDKEQLRKLLADEAALFKNISHIIIDFRYAHGNDASFFNLLFPLIYTNPIFTDALEFRATVLNNAFYEAQFDMEKLSRLEKRRLKKRMKLLNSSLGEFVQLNKLDKSLIYEQKEIPTFQPLVSILTHQSTVRELEQFVAYAKQSARVQLFGTETVGSLGLTNMNQITSPDARYTLRYATARSKTDDNNVQLPFSIVPDYVFDAKKTPHYQWIDEVIRLRSESLK